MHQKEHNEPEILRRDANRVAHLTLNRPTARNALSMSTLELLEAELCQIAESADIRAVVIAGNGPAFCAGHDLRDLRSNAERSYCDALFAKCSDVMLAILQLPQPVIARVHGMASAAGCQLVATCDLAIAAEEAMFATPGVNIGLFCSTPMVALSRNLGRKEAMEMLTLGKAIPALRARELGLVNKVVPADALDEAVREYTDIITSKSAHALAVGKDAYYRQLEMGIRDAYAFASGVMAQNMQAVDAAEGIDAFLVKRTPIWRGK